MKTYVMICAMALAGMRGTSQVVESPSSLAFDDNFINWIYSVALNEWAVQTDMAYQLGSQVDPFRKAVSNAASADEINQVFNKFSYDPEFGDQKMAEHIVHGLYFRQENPGLWNVSSEERLKIIKDAYYTGVNSSDPRWGKFKNDLTAAVFQHCASTGRMEPEWGDIVDCIWGAVKEVVNLVGDFAAIVTAVNAGNWNAAVAAIKRFLKTTGRRLGWLGLALTALDIAICIFT